jgi:hypothetical protein
MTRQTAHWRRFLAFNLPPAPRDRGTRLYARHCCMMRNKARRGDCRRWLLAREGIAVIASLRTAGDNHCGKHNRNCKALLHCFSPVA